MIVEVPRLSRRKLILLWTSLILKLRTPCLVKIGSVRLVSKDLVSNRDLASCFPWQDLNNSSNSSMELIVVQIFSMASRSSRKRSLQIRSMPPLSCLRSGSLEASSNVPDTIVSSDFRLESAPQTCGALKQPIDTLSRRTASCVLPRISSGGDFTFKLYINSIIFFHKSFKLTNFGQTFFSQIMAKCVLASSSWKSITAPEYYFCIVCNIVTSCTLRLHSSSENKPLRANSKVFVTKAE